MDGETDCGGKCGSLEEREPRVVVVFEGVDRLLVKEVIVRTVWKGRLTKPAIFGAFAQAEEDEGEEAEGDEATSDNTAYSAGAESDNDSCTGCWRRCGRC